MGRVRERPQRVGERIKQELMDLLGNELKDPRIGFVSIVRVDVSADLRHARVYFSVLGDDQQKRDSRLGLESATGFLRSQLGARLNLRHVPELSFRADDSIEHGVRIAELLHRVQQPPTDGHRRPGAAAEPGEPGRGAARGRSGSPPAAGGREREGGE